MIEETSMNRTMMYLALLLGTLGFAFSSQAHATTQCAYNFTSGKGNTFLHYCVTVNGNIVQLETPSGVSMIGVDGEGYGICNESPAVSYTDYGVSDTANWNSPVLLSKTGAQVKIARTTSDGHWTLTQTIKKIAKTATVTVVMDLTNNQSSDHKAYLVRFAEGTPAGEVAGDLATVSGTLAWEDSSLQGAYGLLLQNQGNSEFEFMQAYAQTVKTGPNSCAFAFNAAPGGNSFAGSLEIAYAGIVPAGQTKTVTLTYRGM